MAVILKKHVESSRVWIFFPSLLKLFHIRHSLFQKQLILNAQGMKSKSFTYLYVFNFCCRVVTLIKRYYKWILSLQCFAMRFFQKRVSSVLEQVGFKQWVSTSKLNFCRTVLEMYFLCYYFTNNVFFSPVHRNAVYNTGNI